MKAIRLHGFGEPDVLHLDDIDRPEVGPGEVLVRVRAASVNPVDWKIRSGKAPFIKKEQLPVVVGRDLCGAVTEMADDVSDFAAGEEVMANLDMQRGGLAEYVAVPAAMLAPKPRRLSVVEAAALPLAALTAWQGLFDHGGASEGTRVLIHGASGGVGHLAVQFAKARGAWVAATASGADLDFVRGLGADQVIDYKADRFEDAVSDLDLVFDTIGGETQTRSFAVLRQGGRLVSTVGQPDAAAAGREDVGTAVYMAKPKGDQLAEIGRLTDDGDIRVEVQRTYPLEEAFEALRALEQEHTRGKIVVIVSDEVDAAPD